jgi:predicted outer membrane repeat protein
MAATIDVACGDVAGLKLAITSATPGDTINLAMGCTYTLTTVDNTDGAFGQNGLPLIDKMITVEGNNATITRSSAFQFRFFDVTSGGDLTVNRLTMSNGILANQGGAILLKTGTVLATTGVTFSGNGTTGGGGAIYAQVGGAITATADTFSSNSSGGTANGGAILGLGTTTVSRSTFTGNTGDLGGAIAVGPVGNLAVVNSTFTANSASSFGNAIKNFGTATVESSTLSGNPSSTSDGAVSSTGTITLQNTIVANSTPANCSTVGPVTDGGHNISWPDTSCPGLNVDPNVGPLANNGGPTRTMALPPGSPALDGVPATGAGCPPTDQRGVSRPQGPGCDVGAYELQVGAIPGPTPVPPSATGAPVPAPPSTGRTHGSEDAN